MLLMPVVGCSLIGVEPDEIDLAMGSESDGAAETGDQGATEGDPTTGPSTGPDDTTTGDGDGEPGDGDGEAGGDGDGDPSNQIPCEELGAVALSLGQNDVAIAAGPSMLMASCGHTGPEAIYSYTTDAAVNLELTLTADFDAALYSAAGGVCSPLVEGDCVNTPELLTVSVGVGETIYVIVDAATPDGGSGTLDVAIVP
jgi:hypothetical protein